MNIIITTMLLANRPAPWETEKNYNLPTSAAY